MLGCPRFSEYWLLEHTKVQRLDETTPLFAVYARAETRPGSRYCRGDDRKLAGVPTVVDGLRALVTQAASLRAR